MPNISIVVIIIVHINTDFKINLSSIQPKTINLYLTNLLYKHEYYFIIDFAILIYPFVASLRMTNLVSLTLWQKFIMRFQLSEMWVFKKHKYKNPVYITKK